MTEETGNTDRADRSDSEGERTRPQLRTDGGVATAWAAATGDSPEVAGPRGPRSPESPVDGRDIKLSAAKDAPEPDPTVTDPTGAVTTQFSQVELRRLRILASRTSVQSAWVIKRLLRHRDD